MRGNGRDGGPPNSKFFRQSLISSESLESLLEQAYILVRHGRFDYASVLKMPYKDRKIFIDILHKEVEERNAKYKRN